MPVTFQQIRSLSGYEGMSDDDIIKHGESNGLDVSELKAKQPDSITFAKIRTLPGYEGMSDDDIVKHGKSNGLDVSALEAELAKPEKTALTDTVTAVGQGALQIPGMVTGLADIPAGVAGFDRPFSRGAEAIGEATGFKPGQWAKDAEKAYSPEMQEQIQNVNQAWNDPNKNALDVAKAYATNPLSTYKTVVNSLPSMAAGGALGKAALAGGLIKSTAVAAGAGEGAIMAGQSMDNIDKSVSPRTAALASTGVGVAGGVIGSQSGRIANRLGIADVDQLMASGMAAGAGNSALPLGKRMVAGAIQEGPIEEGSQSAIETGMQNYAEDKPITQGMGRNVVEGSIAGAAMGAPAQAIARNKPQPETEYDNHFAAAAEANGLPLDYIKAVAQVESGAHQLDANGKPVNPGTSSALGVMQIIPKWHPEFDPNKLATDAEYNIQAGAKILSDLFGKTDPSLPVDERLRIASKHYFGHKDDVQNEAYADKVTSAMGGAAGQWETPAAKINPDAEAIVQNRTIPGQDTQAVIDGQYQDGGYIPGEQGQVWEPPNTEDANKQAEINRFFFEQEQADIQRKQDELAAMEMNPDISPSDLKQYRKARYELELQKRQRAQDFRDGLGYIDMPYQAGTVKNTQLADQLRGFNARPEQPDLSATDNRSATEFDNAPPVPDGGVTDATQSAGVNSELQNELQQALGSSDSIDTQSSVPTSELSDGEFVIQTGENTDVNQSGKEEGAGDARPVSGTAAGGMDNGNTDPAKNNAINAEQPSHIDNFPDPASLGGQVASATNVTNDNELSQTAAKSNEADINQSRAPVPVPESSQEVDPRPVSSAVAPEEVQGEQAIPASKDSAPFRDGIIKVKRLENGKHSLRYDSSNAEVFPGLNFDSKAKAIHHLKAERSKAANETTQSQNTMAGETALSAQAKGGIIEQRSAVPEKSNPTEQELIDYGFLRQYHVNGKWQYIAMPGSTGWRTSNSKESAIERAANAFKELPEAERKTKSQRFDEASAEYDGKNEKLWGSKSIPELEQELENMGGKISGLHKAGEREFNGGGRRTSAAVSAEGARNLGEVKMRLEGYLRRRKEESQPSDSNKEANAQAKEADKVTMLFSKSSGDDGVALVELSGNEIKGDTPAETRKNANEYINSLINDLIKETGSDTLHNDPTGFDIRLTKKGVVHGFQHHGPQHVKSVAAIKQLIENAVKIAANHHDPVNNNFKNVITLVAPLKLGDQYFAVKLTVKESWDGKFKLYDHQALNMEMPDGISESTSDESDSIHRPASGTLVSLDQMRAAFNGKYEKYLKSETKTAIKPHTKPSLTKAIRNAIDAKFSEGGFDRLLATGKFKVISRDEAMQISSDAARAKGFYDPDTDHSYFVYDNISKDTSAKTLYGLMLHEVGVHQLQLLRNDKDFQVILKQVKVMSRGGKMKEAADMVPKDTKSEHVTEEILAYFIENNPTHSITQKLIQLVRKALRLIGRALPMLERKSWIRWANTLNEGDIISLATSALKQAPDALMFDNVGRENDAIRNSFAGQSAKTADKSQLTVDTDLDAANDGYDKTGIESWSGDAYDYVDNDGFKVGTINKKLEAMIAQYADTDGKPRREALKDAVDQYRTIEVHYFNKDGSPRDGGMLAPNGKQTSLTETQWIQTKTENFRKWFGKSIHVDENGEPSVIDNGKNDVFINDIGQEKLATGNTGTFKRDSNDIRFSKLQTTKDENNTAIKSLFEANKGKQALGWLGGLFQRNHLIDFVEKDLPELINYKHLSQEKDNFINQHEQYVAQAYKEMEGKLDKKTMHELGRVQGMATRLEDFDPATFNMAERGINAQESAVYLAYKALPKAAKEVYAKMRDDYQSDLRAKRQALIERIEQFQADRETKASIIKDIEKHFDKFLKRGVYFPLSRDGNIVITAVNEDGERVKSFIETPKDKDRLVAEMRKQGYRNISVTGKDEYDRGVLAGNAASDMAVLAHRTIGGLREKFRNGQTSHEDFDAMYDEFNQLMINTLPDSSYRKHFIHRKGTLGESTDALRAYAKTRTSAIKNMAALKYDNKIQKVLADADKTIKAMDDAQGDSDTYAIKSVLNELVKREAALKNTEIMPWSQTLTSLGFMGALGFNVGSAAVNMLQVVGVALPELAGRHSFNMAAVEISKAYRMMFYPKVLNRQSGFDLMKNPHISPTTKAALRHLNEIGKIDMTQTHDSIAMGKNPSYSNNALTRTAGGLAKASGYFFHVAEAVNRQVTAIAAFNLAYKKNGGDFEAAIKDTIDVIDRTQFDYGQGNRARYMMSNAARVLTLFKSYAIGMSYYIGRNAYNALKGESPEVRLAARKALITQMAMTFATSGVFGLPIGVEAFAAMGGVAGFKYKGANFAVPGAVGGVLVFQALLAGLGADDEDDIETEFRNWLTDHFDQTTAEWVAKGPARLLPIGDISGRTGLSSLWWQSQNKELEGRDQFNAIATAMMGPLGGQAAGLFTAKKMYDDGEYARMVEAVAPRALSQIIAAARMSENGITNTKGDKIIDRELTMPEIINKVIGFNPTVIANTLDANSAITKQRDKIGMKKAHLRNRYLSAEPVEREALWQGDIAEFNESVEPQDRLTKPDLLRSIRARKAADRHTKNGLYLGRKQEHLRDIGRFSEK